MILNRLDGLFKWGNSTELPILLVSNKKSYISGRENERAGCRMIVEQTGLPQLKRRVMEKLDSY